VSLTDAGEMLLASLAPAFDVIAAALDAVDQFRDTPFGKVRLMVDIPPDRRRPRAPPTAIAT